jgi:hypothetical protein
MLSKEPVILQFSKVLLGWRQSVGQRGPKDRRENLEDIDLIRVLKEQRRICHSKNEHVCNVGFLVVGKVEVRNSQCPDLESGVPVIEVVNERVMKENKIFEVRSRRSSN